MSETKLLVRQADVATVAVEGPLDLAAAPAFRSVLDALSDHPVVTVDLSSCPFVDAHGVGALAGAIHRRRGTGTRVEIIGASSGIGAALDLAGLDPVAPTPLVASP